MNTPTNSEALPPASGSEDVWRSDCCAAPIVIVRSDTSVFDYCSQEPSEALEAELESHDVGEGSEFWMDDFVRVYHHACAKCRKFVGEPWIEETLDSERSLRGILMDLLAAKDEKEKHGDTPRYRALKAGKWESARRILFPQNAAVLPPADQPETPQSMSDHDDNERQPQVGSDAWFGLVHSARAVCPKCSKRGLGYCGHPHALGHKDYSRLSCRYCRCRFKTPERKPNVRPLATPPLTPQDNAQK